ncbi:MAG: PilN domain-containing protein [Candidatus Omnitrophota bacterium]
MILGEKSIISIDIDEGALTAAKLSKKKNLISLDGFKSVNSLAQLAGDPAFKGKSVVLAFPAQALLFRSFSIDSTFLRGPEQKKRIDSFLSRQNLPLNLDDCYWQTFVLGGRLNLIAAKKKIVDNIILRIPEEGFNIAGVIPSFLALYNLVVYNYPEKERFTLLNLRNSSSELLIVEKKQVWLYPLAAGKEHIKEDLNNENILFQELRRILNTHYLQNPSADPKPNSLYLVGTEYSEIFNSVLKQTFTNHDLIPLEPLKKITSLADKSFRIPATLTLSIGLGLSFLSAGGLVSVNLLKAKLKKDMIFVGEILLEKTLVGLGGVVFIFLLFSVIKSAVVLKSQSALLKSSRSQMESALPQVKELKKKKEALEGLTDFLGQELNQQTLYLKALSAISENKSPNLVIEQFEAKVRQGVIEVFLSGRAGNYEEINQFLSKLKNNQSFREVKMLSSELPSREAAVEAVDFQLSFKAE